MMEDNSKTPHQFAVFQYDHDHVPTWEEIVQDCLKAWKLTAPAYRDISETGFSGDDISLILNSRGLQRLPETPLENNKITRNPYITDITEIISMKLVKQLRPNSVFPYPRVLHKERPGIQHHGIDILGYEEGPDGFTLLIVEVMASVQNSTPPSTVREHYEQLFDTLNPTSPDRLIEDLAYIHDECSDDNDKNILNGFLIAAEMGQLRDRDGQVAIPILIRPVGLWAQGDWSPFFNKTTEFESANIPALVSFFVVQSNCSFSDLMNKVKSTVTPPSEGTE